MNRKNILILIIAIFIIGFFGYYMYHEWFYYCRFHDCGDTWICRENGVKWCINCKLKNWSNITLSNDVSSECFEWYAPNLNSKSPCAEIKTFCEAMGINTTE